MKKVLLILADQWRADALGALGGPLGTLAHTPSIDALMARGVTFTNHHTVTIPCGPSRASLLTGLYAMTHRSVVNGTPLDARFTTLPQAALSAGVEPLLVGYTTTTPDPRTTSAVDPRFDRSGTVMPGFLPIAPFHAGQESYLAFLASREHTIPDPVEDLWAPNPAWVPPQGRTLAAAPSQIPAAEGDNAFYTTAAIDALRVRQDRNWLMMLAYFRPHPPFIAPEPWHELVDPQTVPLPPACGPMDHPLAAHLQKTVTQESFIRHGEGLAVDLSEAAVRDIRATYLGMVAELDHQIGRLMAHIEATGELDHTLIVFSSDHGELLGEHGLFGKYAWWENSYRVPLVIVDPRRKGAAGRRVDAYTESVDVMPTILEWLGADPIPLDGRSLGPFLDGGTPAQWRDGVMLEFDLRDLKSADGGAAGALGLAPNRTGAAVWRDAQNTYVRFAGLPTVLHTADDPDEHKNRAGDPAIARLERDLAGRLLDHRITHAERTLTGYQAGPGGLAKNSPSW
ncbi:MAG: sulfatase-like hydrolase/transferase [Pseudomonadota bacterium]